ncbi:serine protease snake-like [Topomyia yanbarensis]|uniref:serine protease snake-like n=1 Tax=Topomyia yanbarensis TaxID=2498891 RepID=UPI00273AE77E|nr:serine protease snake-like [Topomyia yanbarensis]
MIYVKLAFVILMNILLSIIAHQEENLSTQSTLFVKDIPKGYFSRSNLQDCPIRFHRRPTQPICVVFGGTRANATEFPHFAVIGWMEQAQISWKCGGSLITRRFVLTAAHCALDKNNEAPSVVRLGDVDLQSSEDDEYAQQVNISRFIRHPKHRFSAKYYDIALIQLEQEVKFWFVQSQTCLSPMKDKTTNVLCPNFRLRY